jgi:NIMA (never in mitosis gene a)-related kinase
MEFADDGDLADLIGKRKAVGQILEEDMVLRYLVQITQALFYIHTRGILHRDVKTANVFLNKSGILKLGDFGIARILEDKGEATISARTARTPVGTPLYMSPELCLGERYGPKSDIWALGCVLYEVCHMLVVFSFFFFF